MRFGVLGSLHALIDGDDVRFNGPRQTKILAALLIDANRVVPMPRLIDVMWDDDEPQTAVRQIQDAISGLRRNLTDRGAPADLISSHGRGYRIGLDIEQLDLLEFLHERQSADRYTAAGDPENAITALRRALACWRGSALSDVPGHALEIEAMRLDAQRIAAHRQCLTLELAQGRHHEIADELTVFVREHPFDEQSAEQAILALHRCGRRADALALFRDLRTAMRSELGIDPSPALRRLEQAILTETVDSPGSPLAPVPPPAPASAAAPTSAAPSAADTRPTPPDEELPRFQLPTDTRVFTGRAFELKQLAELAREAPKGTSAGMVVLTAIDGMAGIGKSALAVHAAHLLRPQFPDGQLFIDLRGHTAGQEPVPPESAIESLLRSLGVPPQMIPRDPEARGAFYRNRLGGSKTLIILDNAFSAAQVRPLLPATPGCLVIVTSRRRLAGLEDAHELALDVLPAAEAAALLRKVAGPGRADGDDAVDDLVALCGNVPLAIRIAASRLRHRRSLRIEDLVSELRDETARLGHLGDAEASLEVLFDLSYRNLASPEQRMYRLLALIPGLDIDVPAAANLAGTGRRDAERLLETLLDHNLLIQHATGRYRFHDLIRLHARKLVEGDDAAERTAALDRLVDYYLHACQSADNQVARLVRAGVGQLVPRPAVAAELSNRPESMAWLQAERENVLALAEDRDLATSRPERVIALTASLATFLLQEGPWTRAEAMYRSAIEAAERMGNRSAEANALCDLGRVRHLSGDHRGATEFQERSLALFQAIGSRLGEAVLLSDLGRLRLVLGDFDGAVQMEERALEIFLELGHRQGEATALAELGRMHVNKGEYPTAAAQLARARDLYRELGHRHGEANVLADLGRLHTDQGDYAAADGDQLGAMEIFRDLGHRQGESTTTWGLGRIRMMTGDYRSAVELTERAAAICHEIGHRQGENIARCDVGNVRFLLGEYPAAADSLTQALAELTKMGNRGGQAYACHGLGRLRHATGDYGAAHDLLERSLALYREVGDRQGEAETLTASGSLTAETVGIREALDLYRQAIDIAVEIGSPRDEALAREGASRCLESSGDIEAATVELRAAVVIHQRLGTAEAEAAARHLRVLAERIGFRSANLPDGDGSTGEAHTPR